MQRIIGESSTLTEVLSQTSELAPLNRPVLVIGERGSGKELIAERLHFLSGRWQASLHKVNCAAISEQLLESELFGHEAGAFTGATKAHPGRFERADGGTLFLDELATMSLRIQEKLLRLIEYGEFERLGGQKTIKVDIRIIGATNANLPAMVKQQKFRGDLLDRLAFDVINVPPLRRRQSDIPQLVDYFANKMCHELGWDYYSGFTKPAMNELLAYEWPGNIRELKNVVERSLYRWGQPDEAIAQVVINPFARPDDQESTANESTTNESTANEPPANNEQATVESSTQPSDVNTNTASLSFSQQVKAVELKLLKQALAHCQHHQKNTAQHLQLTYHQLRALLKKYKHEL